jgi:hypothetical protein
LRESGNRFVPSISAGLRSGCSGCDLWSRSVIPVVQKFLFYYFKRNDN